MESSYTPSKQTLQNYARVLVNFALGGGKGIKKNDVVYLQFDAPALPLGLEVYRRILETGGHPIVKMNEELFQSVFFESASEAQLKFFPEKFNRSLVDTIDHRIYLMAKREPLHLQHINPQKIMKANEPMRNFRKWLFEKEDKGKFTWTIALYGTEGMAGQANLTVQEYWQQIEKACFLKEKDPIKTWKSVASQIHATMRKLNALPIEKLHLISKDTDLWISYGQKRQFVGGSGRNIPSFELFTSPDWRGIEGTVYFDQPLYRYGNIVQDIHLEFKAGKVIKAHARKNENLLKELIKQKNADKVGEYSLTDHRFSKIDHFMAETLYDENFGGKWGNTHLALGSSYHDCYAGDPTKLKDRDWEALGFNESQEHCDIIATNDRTVEAVMKDGSTKVIYTKGEFVL